MKWLLFLLLLPLCSAAQIRVPGLARIIIAGTHTDVLPVDTTQELLITEPVKNVTFDATRPNKRIAVTGPMFFNMNYINPGYSGQVTFVNSGGWPITFNGSFSGSVPVVTFTANYTYSGGVQWH